MRNVMKATMTMAAMFALGAPAFAQTDWKAERAAARIGEQSDGYLGVVGAGDASLQKLVDDVNNERRKRYFASQQTPKEFAEVTGCSQIEALTPNAMYRTPGGQWKRRGTGALSVPDVLPICLQRAN